MITENTKHKYYDVIVAWASGEKIQVKSTEYEDKFIDYVEFDGCTPQFHSDEWEWRVKPKTQIRRLRMALVNDSGGREVYAIDITGSCLDFPIEHDIKGFIRWIGDTAEVEVEV